MLLGDRSHCRTELSGCTISVHYFPFVNRPQTDADGRPAFAGLRSVSRHGGAWECWALFADRLVGKQLPVQPVRADDAGLMTAARHLGLAIQPDR